MIRLVGIALVPLLLLAPCAAQAAVSPEDLAMVERMGFPASRDGFVRQPLETRPDADYAVVSYRNAAGITLEIGLVHILDMSPKEHYWVRRAELLRDRASYQLVSEGDYRLEGRRPTLGYWGKFRVGAPPAQTVAAVITFDFGRWDVHIRAEYPDATAVASERQIRFFLRSLAWNRLK